MAAAIAAMVASGSALPTGMRGAFSPRTYWISRLSLDFPGAIAAPCWPPRIAPSHVASESSLAGFVPAWHFAQLASTTGRICSRKIVSLEVELEAARAQPAASINAAGQFAITPRFYQSGPRQARHDASPYVW